MSYSTPCNELPPPMPSWPSNERKGELIDVSCFGGPTVYMDEKTGKRYLKDGTECEELKAGVFYIKSAPVGSEFVMGNEEFKVWINKKFHGNYVTGNKEAYRKHFYNPVNKPALSANTLYNESGISVNQEKVGLRTKRLQSGKVGIRYKTEDEKEKLIKYFESLGCRRSGIKETPYSEFWGVLAAPGGVIDAYPEESLNDVYESAAEFEKSMEISKNSNAIWYCLSGHLFFLSCLFLSGLPAIIIGCISILLNVISISKSLKMI